jgi:hypothetical protein
MVLNMSYYSYFQALFRNPGSGETMAVSGLKHNRMMIMKYFSHKYLQSTITVKSLCTP